MASHLSAYERLSSELWASLASNGSGPTAADKLSMKQVSELVAVAVSIKTVTSLSEAASAVAADLASSSTVAALRRAVASSVRSLCNTLLAT